jgi:catechol 2,3-dioxygenase-like lactoylglutathione lyase family enzyme
VSAILAVDHINIATPRLAATRDFYVQVLGLREGPRPAFAVEGYWLYAGGAPVVHLQVAAEPVAPSRTGALNHAAFLVADFDGLVARLERHGTPCRLTQVPGTGVRQAFFEDPNGVRLELNEAPAAERGTPT